MISKAIADYLKYRGITVISLCEKTGLTQKSLSLALRGQRNFSIDEYAQICNALELPYEYFFENNRSYS